jgi:hypothetical protein
MFFHMVADFHSSESVVQGQRQSEYWFINLKIMIISNLEKIVILIHKVLMIMVMIMMMTMITVTV